MAATEAGAPENEIASPADEPSIFMATLGRYLLRVGVRLARLGLRARVEIVRDRQGRATPCLILGKARRGTLVFLHGFSDRTDSFLPTARFLRKDFRIIVPALPGFGDGWIDPTERHTFQAYGRWLGDVVEQVAPAHFHLMGNSLGGASALAIAARMPGRVSSLILCDTAGVRPPGIASVYDEVAAGHNLFAVRTRTEFQQYLGRVFAKTPRFPRPVAEHLYAEQRSNARWYARVMADLHDDNPFRAGARAVVELERIHAPTLVVWGEHDSLFPVAIGEHIASSIPAAKLHVLRGIGHVPHLEAPPALARAFARFAAAAPR